MNAKCQELYWEKYSGVKAPINEFPTTPTRLTVNIAAVAAANTDHCKVPQNLFRKPETHAHLEKQMNCLCYIWSIRDINQEYIHTHRVLPEHGCDHLPGEREDTDPDKGDGDRLQKLVKLVVCESCKDKSVNKRQQN